MPVPCAVCEKLLRRIRETSPAYPYVHTRTLVGEDFLPSCSEDHANILRGRSFSAQHGVNWVEEWETGLT